MEDFELNGSEEWVEVEPGRCRILAPGFLGRGQVAADREDAATEFMSFQKESGSNALLPDGEALLAAIQENEAFLDKVLRFPPTPAGGTEIPFYNAEGIRVRPRVRLEVRMPEPGTGAVLRVIHESGHITWHLPDEDSSARMSAVGDAPPTFRFTVPHVPSPPEAGPLGLAMGPLARVGRKIFSVIRFFKIPGLLADALIEVIVGKIEKRHFPDRYLHYDFEQEGFREGFPPGFGPSTDILSRQRTLMFVHGTFSRTDWAFEGLFREEERDFRKWLRKKYRHVLARDHKTLTKTPQENAEEILDSWPFTVDGRSVDLDLISHSRGGLVSRFLAERDKADLAAAGMNIERLLMFATPNRGTPLASQDKIPQLISILNNLVGLVGGPAFLSLILSVLKLAAHGILELPGLKAQAPGSDQLRLVNGRPDGQPTEYFVARADFRPDDVFRGLLIGMERRLIFDGKDHDAVVPYDGVPRVDKTQKIVREERFHGPEVHHTNMFEQLRSKEFIRETLDPARGISLGG